MCFSATASFAASAVLGSTGALALKQTREIEGRFMASIPFLFAVQQFLEGVIWLYPGEGLFTMAIAYGYLFFAFLLWPIYIPLVAYIHEQHTLRRHLLFYLLTIGSLGSTYLLYLMVTKVLTVSIVGHSVQYHIPAGFQEIGIVLYVFVTVGALVISSSRALRWFGIASFAGAMIAWQFYRFAFTSVWCFFAAILSIIILIVLFRKRLRFDKILKKA